MIIQDVEKLRQISKAVDLNDEYTNKVLSLVSEFPSTALGLAAPQIDMFERLFVANLSSGTYVFINPVLTEKSEGKHASAESCLSLPNITRTVPRHLQVKINADATYKIGTNCAYYTLEPIENGEMILTYQDACIVQHEYDHLEGILIIDLPVYEVDTKFEDKKIKRLQKISARRSKKSNTDNVSTKKKKNTNSKKAAKLKKQNRKARKREQRRVEIQERYKAIKEGLLQ